MEHTIKKIEGWLNSNLNDVYSKRELVGFLESILDGLKKEQEEASPSFDPDFKILKDVFLEMFDTLKTDYLATLHHQSNRYAFEDAIELTLTGNGREIGLDIDNYQIAEICYETLDDNLPSVETFVDIYREKCMESRGKN